MKRHLLSIAVILLLTLLLASCVAQNLSEPSSLTVAGIPPVLVTESSPPSLPSIVQPPDPATADPTAVIPGQVRIAMQRKSISFLDAVGEEHPIMYYDMPVLLLDSYEDEDELCAVAARKINTYFQAECDAFFVDEKAVSFLKTVEVFFSVGKDTLLLAHLANKMTAAVTHNGDDILSIHHGMFWFAGGVSCSADFGAVFDLRTGERLLLSDFIDADFSEFQDTLLDFYFEQWKLERQWWDTKEELLKYSIRSSFEDYQFYYKDGELYIALRGGLMVNAPDDIICWSVADNVPVRMVTGYSDAPPPWEWG